MHDVVIVGAGPVGLFLACELGLAGCSVLVLERDPEPSSPRKAHPLGLRGLSTVTVEALHRRGILTGLLAASGIRDNPRPDSDASPGAPEPSPSRGGGHFGGMMLDPAQVDVDAAASFSSATAEPFPAPRPVTWTVMTSLEALEAVLSSRAAELGVEIRRGVNVSAVAQDGDGVTARAGQDVHPARLLVGCDGGRSAVRGLAGFDFVGTEPQFTGFVMLAALDDPGKLNPGFTLTQAGMYIRMPAEDYLGVLECDGGAFDRSRTPTREHLQAVLRRVSGTDVTLSGVRAVTSFTDRAMQTTSYRKGRVLLAGDAAHIHSPLGAQGLNLGLGDAMNLGWKLAATVRGHAPDGLLDTYTRERHPLGAEALDWTRAQAAVMRPDPHALAIQNVVRDLIGTRDGATRVFARISGLSNRYDLGGEHPLVGRDAPDLRLADGTRLAAALRDGRGVALDFSDGSLLRGPAARWASRMRYAEGRAEDGLGRGAVLVRPDGTVAWTGEREPGRLSFERAAARWFGRPDHDGSGSPAPAHA